MVVEINQIGFCEQPGDFGMRVINWFIGVNTQDNFFLSLMPVLDLGY